MVQDEQQLCRSRSSVPWDAVPFRLLRPCYSSRLSPRSSNGWSSTCPTLPPARCRREEFDRRYVAHPWLAYLHIAPGVLYLLLAPLQLAYWFRSRHYTFHRRLGRMLAGAAMLSGAFALMFGGRFAFGGLAEASAAAVFGLWSWRASHWLFGRSAGRHRAASSMDDPSICRRDRRWHGASLAHHLPGNRHAGFLAQLRTGILDRVQLACPRGRTRPGRSLILPS